MKTVRYGQDMGRTFRRGAERGWRMGVVFSEPPDNDSWLDPIRDAGAYIEYLPRPKRNFDWGAILRAKRVFQKLGCTVLHCDNVHTSPMIGAALAGVPIRVWTKHSMQPWTEEGRTPSFREWLAPSVRSTYTLATRVLAVSNAVRADLMKLRFDGGKTMVYRNAVDPPDHSKFDRAAIRRELGVEQDELMITNVGHAVPVKAWDVLVAAFAPIAAKLPKARLVLVGSFDSPHERETNRQVRALVEKLGLTQRVTFAGYAPFVFAPLIASDMFVLSSRSEGDPYALLEGLAAGLPCISTRVGSADERIQDGVNGLLVPREDVAALSNAMMRLATDEALRGKFVAAVSGRKHAPTHAEYGDGLLDVYADLLKQKGFTVNGAARSAKGVAAGAC